MTTSKLKQVQVDRIYQPGSQHFPDLPEDKFFFSFNPSETVQLMLFGMRRIRTLHIRVQLAFELPQFGFRRDQLIAELSSWGKISFFFFQSWGITVKINREKGIGSKG